MKPGSQKRAILLVLAAGAVIVIALGFLFPAEDHGPEFWFSHIEFFPGLLGLAGCIILILVSKWLGHHWLHRKGDYYD